MYLSKKNIKEEFRHQRLKATFDALDYNVSDKMIDKLADEYINSLSTFPYAFEGTFEILEYLKTKYQLHIITNGF